ncbi:hypothetical protein [Streptacidiphilus sp. PAMC 29251]
MRADVVRMLRRPLWSVLDSLSTYGLSTVVVAPPGWWDHPCSPWRLERALALRPVLDRAELIPHWHPER